MLFSTRLHSKSLKIPIIIAVLGILINVDGVPLNVVSSALGSRKDELSYSVGDRNSTKEPRHAYLSLLYGEKFVLGARVLGRSLKKSGTRKEMVVLLSNDVSYRSERLLRADGWIPKRVKLVKNPNKNFPKPFYGVYTKLLIFNLTEYEKVVYLDADTMVMSNIDELFHCRQFCANLKHSERFNTGVLVVKPDKQVFEDMARKITILESYTGGDQGFLNSYFYGFPNARLFDPELTSLDPQSELQSIKMERLSTVYNADVGLFMLANKWMVPEAELKIIHFTLGPLKPWDWWTHFLIQPVTGWQKIRQSLPIISPVQFYVDLISVLYLLSLFVLPVFGVSLAARESSLKRQQIVLCFLLQRIPVPNLHKSSHWKENEVHFSLRFGSFSVLACFFSLFFGVLVSQLLVPSQVLPWVGFLLSFEISFSVFVLLFANFLFFVRMAAHASNSSDKFRTQQSKAYLKSVRFSFDAHTTSCFYGLFLSSFLFPILPSILGVSALLGRLAIVIAGGILTSIYFSLCAQNLAARFYLEGRKDALQSQPFS